MKITSDEFDRLALEHLDMLYRIARRLARDPTRAEDLVQETYLRAYRARDSFELQQFGIRPWLVRILHNLHYTRSARENRQPQAVEDAQLEATAGVAPPPLTINPKDLQAMDERLVRALEDLPTEYQSVLLLWAVEGFAYKEIADALNVPIGTVMSRLHRARARLSEQLRDFAKDEGIIRE